MRVYRVGSGGKKSFFKNLSAVGWIILINIVIFILTFILIAVFKERAYDYFALKPSSILQGKYLWTLVTHMFSHGGFFHLFVNMFVLFSLGGLCEKIIGRKRFIWFYLISGLFAGVLSVLLAGFYGSSVLGERIFGSPDLFMVGASGAIFAIAGLFVMLLPRLKFFIIFFPFVSFPGYILIPLALFLMWGASILFSWPIGNVAHFGGFLVGIVYGYYLKTKYKRKVEILRNHFSRR